MQQEEMRMAVPYGKRFPIEFDELFPEGAYVVGAVTAVTEYQSQEDKARNRPVRPRIDEASGLPIFKVTIADPAAEKDRDKSITVEIAARVQPVPPAAANRVAVSPGGVGGADGTATGGGVRTGEVDHMGGQGNRHARGRRAERQWHPCKTGLCDIC